MLTMGVFYVELNGIIWTFYLKDKLSDLFRQRSPTFRLSRDYNCLARLLPSLVEVKNFTTGEKI